MARGALIYGELEPSRSGTVVYRRATAIASLYGRIDIPDVPLGKPNISAPVVAAFLAGSLRPEVIAHLRVIDHNIVSIKSIIKTLSYFNVKKMIFLHGDEPQQGGVCETRWTPEDAVKYAGKYNVEGGLLLSLRRNLEHILERVRFGAPAYYATRYDGSRELREKLERIRSSLGNSVLGVYMVVGTDRNRVFLESIGSPFINYNKIIEEIDKINDIVDRIIISAPGDGDAVLKIGVDLLEVGLL